MEKYIKVTDLLNSKLIFSGFPSELVKEEIEKLSFKDDRIDKAILYCDDLLNNEGYYYSDEWDAALNKMKEFLQSLNK